MGGSRKTKPNVLANCVLIARINARQIELGGRADAEVERRGGLKPGYLNNLRRGASQGPRTPLAPKLAKGLDWSVAELLGEKTVINLNDPLIDSSAQSGSGELDSRTQPTGAENMRDSVDDLLDMLDTAELAKWPSLVKIYRRMTGRNGHTLNPKSRRRT